MSSSIDQMDKYENEFSEFLIKRIGNAGGSLQLQHVTGHLSQLSYDIRNTIGTSRTDLINFLKRHKNLFDVDAGVVRLVNYSSSKDGYDSDCSSVGPQLALPLNITNGKGVIIKIFPAFGFIKVKEPIKTEVYFQASSFGKKDIDLTASLFIGTMVYFHAKKKSHEKNRSKYYAIKVWKVDESDVQSNTIVQKTRKSRETGLYDPLTLDSEGIIQNVFPNLGFIAVKGDESNTVFFYKNRLVNYDNITDLTKVLSKGDVVEFNAHRSTKQDAKARWEATKVWKKSQKIKTAKLDSSHCNSPSSVYNHSEIDIKNENKAKEMIRNQCGKICPRSNGAVIKFGKNELADGDSGIYYVCGSKVNDISWEFSEGDDVSFDAVKIKSAPGWKAVLVWVGSRPDIVLPTCLGDFSEFTDEENEDILGSCVSQSSNSSLKSLSLKSETNSSKSRGFKNGKSSKLSLFPVNREVKECNKREYKMSSQYSSQSSLSSSVSNRRSEDQSNLCSSVSKNSQRSSKERKKETFSINRFSNAGNKTVSNWGDSPYPAEEIYENMSTSQNDVPDVPIEHILHKVKVSDDEGQSISEDSSSVEKEKTNEKMVDIHDFSNSAEEVKNDTTFTSESKKNLNKTASVRKLQDIKGRILKVYSKFAEVKSNKLQNAVSFFWNNFYINGVSVDELELQDLKKVLEVGDAVHFNYFEIVDDSGQNWQKVSLAWSGCKPKKAFQISPEDFIQQNNLSVSISNESNSALVEEDEVTSRKFLTAFIDVDHGNQADKISRTESCSDDETMISTKHSKVAEQLNETLPAVDCKMLLITVSEILKKNLLSPNSQVDLHSVSGEIINIVLENHNLKSYGCESCKALLQDGNCVKRTTDDTCADYGKNCLKNFCYHRVKTENSEVQTIITGEIIAQNIFTEC